jgi:hypothetical protein
MAQRRNGKIQKISLFAYLDIEPLRLYDFKPLSRCAFKPLRCFCHSPVNFLYSQNLPDKKLIKLCKLKKFLHFCERYFRKLWITGTG